MALRHRLRRNVLDDADSTTRVERAVADLWGAAPASTPSHGRPPSRRCRIDGRAIGRSCRRGSDRAVRRGTGGDAAGGRRRADWVASCSIIRCTSTKHVRRCGAVAAARRRAAASRADRGEADRLIGGVDLAATLSSGRLVAERGVLAAADGGIVVLPMAERASVAGAHHAVLKCSTAARCRWRATASPLVTMRAWWRCCSTSRWRTRPCIRRSSIAWRSGWRSTRRRGVLGRVASSAAGDGVSRASPSLAGRVREARDRASSVVLDDQWLQALCKTAELFGIASARGTLFAAALRARACRARRSDGGAGERRRGRGATGAGAARHALARDATGRADRHRDAAA